MFLFALSLMVIALASLWIGVPNATRLIAYGWLARTARIGVPIQWGEEYLYPVFRVAAFLTILAGWLLLAELTVFLVRLVF
jgi:hypothetical protein